MAPHSSTLAWKIPWTEEPGRLQSMGSQRVGHDSATEQQQCTTFPNQVWVEDPREVQTSQWSSKVQSEKTKKTFK